MADGRVEGKVAFITGAARGQGRAHAVKLASEGADIIAVDICGPIRNLQYPPATPEDLAQTVQEVEGLGRRIVSQVVDVRDLEHLTEAAAAGVEVLGGIDIVIANAAIAIMAPWDKVAKQVWQDTLDINLTGSWNTVMATAPHVISRGGGSIILVSSAAGLKGLPFLMPYVASKHGVTGIARAFAHELAIHNIRVNSLHPTGVRTPMRTPAMGGGDNVGSVEEWLESNPRLGGMFTNSLDIEATDPEDQANAALFLASDESRYVTALAMTVDAGITQY